MQDDTAGAAPGPAPLSAPRVLPGFPPLAAASGQTASPGGQTTLPPSVQRLAVRPPPRVVLPPGPVLLLRRLFHRLWPPHVRRPQLRPRPTQRPRLHQCHVRPRHLRLRLHHPRLRRPNPTHSTTHISLGLRESHRHRLYISSRRDEGRTDGTSGQSSSDDHAGEAGFPAFGRHSPY
jgi:hypothetical protein